jgi:hypothetical protein
MECDATLAGVGFCHDAHVIDFSPVFEVEQ